MSFLIKNISKIYTYIVLKISPHLLISCVIIYSYTLPFYNIVKILFNIKFSLYHLLGFICVFYFFFLLLKYNQLCYNAIRHFLFCDFFYENRKILSHSRIVMNKYPKIFCLYIFISSHLSFIFFQNTENLWLYFLYITLLLYRNIFVFPINGFVFIVNSNFKKYEIVKTLSKKHIKKNVLFSDFYFLNNLFLKTFFECWINWIEEIKLSEKSLKIISKLSIFIFLYWIVFYFIFCISKLNS